jgi:hypothetical protein
VARLEEAVAAYRDALQELTRARVPLQWARTQNNLGNALLRLGVQEGGTAARGRHRRLSRRRAHDIVATSMYALSHGR